jgi:YVTN family beta-propeller protein
MMPPERVRAAAIAAAALMALGGCGAKTKPRVSPLAVQSLPAPALAYRGLPSTGLNPGLPSGYRVPPPLSPDNVYAADAAGDLSAAVRGDPERVYVPNSASNTVDEIDPRTYRIVRHFSVGLVPQHVVPAYDLHTLWVTNDIGNSLTPINPRTGAPGRPVQVEDPYNMYFTPDGRYALVMAEQLRRIDFRDPHTMRLVREVRVPGCAGVNHADYTASGRYMLVSCEFAAEMVVIDVPDKRLVATVRLPPRASPQDVKLSPRGGLFYVADLTYGGVWKIDATNFRVVGFLPTGSGAHGLYPSRDATRLYVSNRGAGSVSVVDFRSGRVVATWNIGGSPDMGGVSADGRVLWLSARYDACVYAIDTRTGKLRRRIAVGDGPHGLSFFPQPGRYSLGHTGIMR